MKGVILAGGSGTRLFPITKAVSKQLIPVYDKPLIYYPLSVLMLAKIREIMIIVDPKYKGNYEDLLGDGENFGLKIIYAIQENPRGIAEAILISKKFIKNDKFMLILGDNLFYGAGLSKILEDAQNNFGATIFTYQVLNPTGYGVIKYKNNRIEAIVEKPSTPESDHVVTGMYIYDHNAVSYASEIIPSARNELEITDVNNLYLRNGLINQIHLNRGVSWFDIGTIENYISASNFIKSIEDRQGLKIACLEEIGFRNKWIDKNIIMKRVPKTNKNSYHEYLEKVIN